MRTRTISVSAAGYALYKWNDSPRSNRNSHSVRNTRVDPNDAAFGIGQRPPGIAGREPHVCLDQLATSAAVNHATRDCANVAQRIAHRNHEFPDA
jgi:hypothetical protein